MEVGGDVLSFADPNPDLKFFRPGDVVQSNADPTNIEAGDTVEVRISGEGTQADIDMDWANATVAETLTLFNVQNGGNSGSFPGNQKATSFLLNSINQPMVLNLWEKMRLVITTHSGLFPEVVMV